MIVGWSDGSALAGSGLQLEAAPGSESLRAPMPWKQLPDPTKEEFARGKKRWLRDVRFLLDENLGQVVGAVLKRRGYNVRTAAEAGLIGRSDEEYYRAARREGRVLLTQDEVFRNDRRFPVDRQPGIVILAAPPSIKEQVEVFRVVANILGIMAPLLEGSKAHVDTGGHVTFRRRSRAGQVIETRYRFDRKGPTFVWED
jgi:predicted nuclease of predicted toxin-antitoxin system